jgi:hypothetical protein
MIEEKAVRLLTDDVERIAVLGANRGRADRRLRITGSVLVAAARFTSIKILFLSI